jgi:hypothetical protein
LHPVIKFKKNLIFSAFFSIAYLVCIVLLFFSTDLKSASSSAFLGSVFQNLVFFGSFEDLLLILNSNAPRKAQENFLLLFINLP